MTSPFLVIMILLAFGPLAIMGALYIVALLLWFSGRPELLAKLSAVRKMTERGKPADPDEEQCSRGGRSD